MGLCKGRQTVRQTVRQTSRRGEEAGGPSLAFGGNLRGCRFGWVARLLLKRPSRLWEVRRSEREENNRERRLCVWLVGPYLEMRHLKVTSLLPQWRAKPCSHPECVLFSGHLQSAEANPGPSAPEAQEEQQSRPRHTHETRGHEEAVPPDGSGSENGRRDMRSNPEIVRGSEGH